MLRRFLARFDQPTVGTDYLQPLEEAEALRALDGVRRLRPKLHSVVSKPEALAALQDALFQTRQYVERRRAGEKRNAATEQRLSASWSEVGSLLLPHDPDLAAPCWVKGHGWADDRIWSDPRFRDLPIELNDMLQRLYQAMLDQATRSVDA
jgi:hypothetical protein